MLDINRRNKRPKRRTTGSVVPQRPKPRRSSRRPYEHTAHTAQFTVYGRGDKSLLDKLASWRRGRHRRSQSRLGKRTSLATTGAARPRVRVQPAVHVTGRALVNIAVIGLLGWLLIWLFAADQFYVREIVVQGNQRVSAEAIAAASGLEGYSIFWVNPGAVSAAITDALPPVRWARVLHSLPNKVVLTVEEQGDQVMWVVAGNRYWVEDDGTLHLAQGGQEPELLVRDIRPGLPTAVDVEAVLAARQLAVLLPELDTIDYAPITGLHYAHPAGWVVYLGTGEDMPQKVYVMRAIEQRLAVEGVRQPDLVDIRYPESPFYRYPGE